jgi:hypothetical protein
MGKMMNNHQLMNELRRYEQETMNVVIGTADRGLIHHTAVPVTGFQVGTKWSEGLLFIQPAKQVVVVRTVNQPIEELARERLERAKKVYGDVGFRYVRRGCEDEWISGFIEGVHAHVTSCSGERARVLPLKLAK